MHDLTSSKEQSSLSMISVSVFLSTRVPATVRVIRGVTRSFARLITIADIHAT